MSSALVRHVSSGGDGKSFILQWKLYVMRMVKNGLLPSNIKPPGFQLMS